MLSCDLSALLGLTCVSLCATASVASKRTIRNPINAFLLMLLLLSLDWLVPGRDGPLVRRVCHNPICDISFNTRVAARRLGARPTRRGCLFNQGNLCAVCRRRAIRA